MKLDRFEQDIEDHILEYESVSETKRKRIEAILKRAKENIDDESGMDNGAETGF